MTIEMEYLSAAKRLKASKVETRTSSARPARDALGIFYLLVTFLLAGCATQKQSIVENRTSNNQTALDPAPPLSPAAQAKILALGPTASISDLKDSTDRDQIRINIYVSLAVFLVLMALLRQPALCAYLILTVIFSYLVTLGAAFIVFRITTGPDFVGLDWKVPVYLFTLLLALGEDYNVLFMSRVTEEQPKHGAIPGILIALTKTGGIISSCGVIMAGTSEPVLVGDRS